MAAISRDFVTKNGIVIEGDSAVTSSTNQVDALQAAGGAAIAKNLIVGTTATIFGDTTLRSSLTVNGQTNLGGPVIPTTSGVNLGSLANPFKDLYLTGSSLYVGNVVLSSSSTVATFTSTLGSVKLVSGSSRLTDTTNATSTTTGALVVGGGIGVARDLFVGKNLNVVNDSTLQGPASLQSTLSVAGIASFNDETAATIIGAGSVQLAGGIRVGGNIVVMSTSSNTGTLASNALYVAGGVGINNGLAVSGTAVFKNDVYFQGATTYVYSTNTIYTDNILDLHVPLTGIDGTWIADDGKDIGFRFNYYNSGTDKNALLLLTNNSKKLEFFSDSTEVNGIITNATYGDFKTGSIQVANNTSNTGNTNTGALQVVGGVGIGGSLYVAGTVTATNISLGGTINAQGLVFQDASGKLVSQSNILYSTSTQKLVGTITRADNLTGGTIGSIPIQVNNGITTFISPGSSQGQTLLWDIADGAPYWGPISDVAATLASTATHLAGGLAGNLPYQNNIGRTTFLANGANGSVLTFNTATLSPQWTSPGTLSVSYANTSTTSTYAYTATYATYASNASIATTATYTSFANTATYALLATTATYALLAETSTHALLADTATRALLADTATLALLANTATYALLANTATYALLAETSTHALLADTATLALLANTATYALLAETSTHALLADTATYAVSATNAVFADLAYEAVRALLADTATHALLADTATHAISADFATSSTYAFTSTYAEFGGQSTVALNLANGTVGQIPYQTGTDLTSFFGPGNAGEILVSAGASLTGPVFTNTSSIRVGYAANVLGGAAGSIVYQAATGTTAMLAVATTAGSLLASSGSLPQYINQVRAVENGTESYSTSSGQSLSVTTGGLGIVGNSYFSNNLGVGGTLYLAGDLYVDGTQFVVNKDTISTGDKTITLSTGAATAILAIDSGLQVGSISTPYASFLYNGVDSWVIGGTAGSGLKVTSTASVSSANSGALQVAGGVGVAGNIFVAGVITATTFFGNLTGIATTATRALLADTATRALLADTATLALLANTATYALLAETSTHALLADTATLALLANTATLALLANTATLALLANTATYALTATFATSSTYAFTATYAAIGGQSAFATSSSWASTASNINGGGTGSIPVQSSYGITSFLGIGTSTYLLVSDGSNPVWTSLSSLSSGNTAFADNIKGGSAGQIVYQISSSTTGFVSTGSVGNILVSNGTGAPSYTSTSNVYVGHAVLADTATLALLANTATLALNANTSTLALLANTATLALNANTATYATNILGGSTGSVVYQSAENTTALLAGGSTGSILTYINNLPTWSTTATLSGGVGSSSTVNGQTLKVTNGGIGVIDNSYFANNLGVGGSIYVATTSYIGTGTILTSIDLQTVTYTATYLTNDPTSVTGLVAVAGTSTAYGTYNFGTLADIQTFNDYNTGTNTGFYSINDATGAPAFVVYIGFTGVTDFNRVVLNINYTANSGHTEEIDLYNWVTQGWDTFTTYSGSINWFQFILAVINPAPYISSGKVWTRVYHVSSGNTAHRTWIDYVALEKSIQGGQGPRGATGAQGIQGIQGLTTTTTSTFFFNNATDSDSTVTGAVTIVGGAGIGKTLNVGSSATILSTASSTSTVQNNALYVAGGVGIAKSLYVTGEAIFSNNVVFSGTTTYVLSTNTVYTDNIIELHYPSGTSTWSVNDSKDIGLRFHYYNTSDANAFLGLDNATGYLEWLVSASPDNVNNIVGTGGTFRTGGIVLTSTTASSSTATGALTVAGGIGIGGALYVASTSYIAGAQIITTATVNQYASQTTIFAGTDTAVNTSTGAVTVWNTGTLQTVTSRGSTTTVALSITNTTSSISTTTGALKVSGGVGVGDSVYVGNRVGYGTSTGTSAVYQYYNAATNSLDTVFG